MKNKLKNADLVRTIKSLIAKSRGSLAEDDVKTLEKACKVLAKLDDVESKKAKAVMTEITKVLLRVLLRPELLEKFGEWFSS